MLSNIGPATMILIIIVALLLFGPSKLPELGRAFGKTLREFKNGAKEMMDEEEPQRKEVSRTQAADHNEKSGTDNKDENRRLPD